MECFRENYSRDHYGNASGTLTQDEVDASKERQFSMSFHLFFEALILRNDRFLRGAQVDGQ